MDFRGKTLESSPPVQRRGRGRALARLESQKEKDLLEKQKSEMAIRALSSSTQNLDLKSIACTSSSISPKVLIEESAATRGHPRGSTKVSKTFIIGPELDEYVGGKELKNGKIGGSLPLISNYYRLNRATQFNLYQYRIDFQPQEDNLNKKKALLRCHKEILGPFTFDGTLLYTSKLLEGSDPGPLVKDAVLKRENAEYRVEYRLTKVLHKDDGLFAQFFNLLLRKCLYAMNLEVMGRNFFDPSKPVVFNQHKLELWPGFITSIRKHDAGALLCVEITHKVIRTEKLNILISQTLAGSNGNKKAAEDAICGSIVLTSYNRKTYHVTDIAWDMRPSSTFDYKGVQTSFRDYYAKKYSVTINDMNQPLLIAYPKERKFLVWEKASEEKIILVPETCQLTGLTDQMRNNFTLMKDLSRCLHTPPMERIRTVQGFMDRLLQNEDIKKELDKWELDFNKEMEPCRGRVFPIEGIVFAGTKPEMANDKADWTQAFRHQQMLTTVHLERWVLLVPQRDCAGIDKLIATMTNVARPLNMQILPPKEIVKLVDTRVNTYAQAIDKVVRFYGDVLQLVFVVLPNNKADLYSGVKKKLTLDFGIPSQCFLLKNVNNAKGLMSVATKVVIQINAKLGGQPWGVQLPLKKTMFVGFDVYHGGIGGESSSSVGALVSTTSQNFASYFSTVSRHKNAVELSKNLNADFKKALKAYESHNQFELPDRIIFYRDGVGQGQLKHVQTSELDEIQTSLREFYGDKGKEVPKFNFIVVNKKINARLFAQKQYDNYDNPPPGTVLDNTITLPDRFDFYLVSTAARQGTVSPCSYTMLTSGEGLDADKIQRMTYKMCHMYYNWSGTVAVPAPCQYAHKLAYLTGLALGAPPSAKLQNLLHFL